VRSLLIALAIVGTSAGTARAGAIRGVVFADRDRDGVQSTGEPGIAGAVVAWETSVFTRTDRQGAFALEAPGAGLVWVRIPDGFVPGPVWQPVDVAGADDVALGVVPVDDDARAAPVTFVVAADTHMTPGSRPWGRAELATAVRQAVALEPAPRFFTIVGDVTQANTPSNFADVEAVMSGVDVPWVPVAGNHDWYDGGAAWRARFGPDSYSFDIGDVHFVVWNTNLDDDDARAFLTAELGRVDPAMTVVALGHAPPSDAVVEAMRDLGVDYVLTGHWHTNRVVDHGGLVELTTEPFVMGGMDFTPAGYRVITIDAGRLTAYHRTVVDEPYLALVAPAAGSCASAAGFDLLAAAEVDASRAAVTAAVDCGAERLLEPVGGWSYRGRIAGLAPGSHQLTLRARGVDGDARRDVTIDVCPVDHDGARRRGSWPQLQGGADHRGQQAEAIAPPLAVVWTASVGGHLHRGGPVVAGDAVFVAVSDLGGGDRGGVAALDLTTGAERWRHIATAPVRNAPAVADGVVVIGLVDGEVRGFDAATGAPRWSYRLGDGLDARSASLFAAPTIADGVVYVTVERRLAALDLQTGAELWALDPRGPSFGPSSSAAPTVAAGIAIASFDRVLGVVAYDAADGRALWRLRGEPAISLGGSPVSDGDSVFVANGRAEVGAFDLVTGAPRWHVAVAPGGGDWSYSTAATPALADGRLFVATLFRDLVALDAASGAELWRYAAGPSPVHTTHYRGRDPAGFESSPLVTGDLVWIGGADGHLAALDAATGDERWSLDVGAPILADLAAAGDYLIVPSWDGTVRALAPAPHTRTARLAPARPSAPPRRLAGGDALLAGLTLAAIVRRRRERGRQPPSGQVGE